MTQNSASGAALEEDIQVRARHHDGSGGPAPRHRHRPRHPRRAGPASWRACPVAAAVLDVAGIEPGLEVLRSDGDRVWPGDVVARVTGPLAAVLGTERTMLNVLTHLSGIATVTRTWVDAVAGTGCQIRDTRKTIPGLRQLAKYAVRCGGGVNHRMGLGDAALIKDNHVVAAGGITAAFQAVRAAAPHITIEVECDTLRQVGEALTAGASLILLDNMVVDQLTKAVEIARDYPAAKLEASGGLRPGKRTAGGGDRRPLPVRRRPHALQHSPGPRPGHDRHLLRTRYRRTQQRHNHLVLFKGEIMLDLPPLTLTDQLPPREAHIPKYRIFRYIGIWVGGIGWP